MTVTLEMDLLDELRHACGSETIETAVVKVGKLSKDYYWHFPVLKEKLDDKVAGYELRCMPSTSHPIIRRNS